MYPRRDRNDYEREVGTYRQPRYFFRKVAGWFLPRLPGFRLRARIYHLMGYNIHRDIKFIGLDCYIDDHFPELITIDEGVVVSFKATIVAHDDASHTVAPVHIGRNSFIGTGAIILPGVHIGEGCTVGAGSVVTKDIEPGATVVGVPAQKVA